MSQISFAPVGLLSVVVGDSRPAMWVGVVVSLLALLTQRRQRLWAREKISTRPVVLVAFGLLVFYGYTGVNGALDAGQEATFLGTLAGGVLLGAIRAWTLWMWSDQVGLHVKGSTGTVGLLAASVGGACLAFGLGHVGFEGLPIFVGATLLSQQLCTILRGSRVGGRLPVSREELPEEEPLSA